MHPLTTGIDPTATGGGGGGAPTGPAGGALTGTYPDPGVNVGAGALVIGVLPSANQAAQTMAGDVTGTTAASLVTTITGTGGVATLAGGTAIVAAAGSGGMDLGLATGQTRLSTGAFKWGGTAGQPAQLIATAASITITADAASVWKTTTSSLSLDAATALNLGATTATSIVVGTTGSCTAITCNVTSTGVFEILVGAANIMMQMGAASTDQMSLGTATAFMQMTPTSMVFGTAAANPTFSQNIAAVNTPPSPWTISAQSASLTSTTGTAANTTGATLILKGGLGSSGNGGVWQAGDIQTVVGTPSAAGTEAYLKVLRGASVMLQLGAQVGATTTGAIYGPGITPSNTNYSFNVNTTGNPVLNGPTSASIAVAGVTEIIATATAVSIKQPLGGISGSNAFAFQSVSVALTSGVNNTLTSAQYNFPHIKFTGTLTGAGTTITFPATDGAFWLLDFSAIVTITDSISLIANGNTWGTALASANDYVLIHYTAGSGRLVGILLTQ